MTNARLLATRASAFLVVFVAGFIIGGLALYAIYGTPGTPERISLALVVIAVGLLAVVVPLFVLSARNDLARIREEAPCRPALVLGTAREDVTRELARLREGWDSQIGDAQRLLGEQLKSGLNDLREGIASVRKECLLVFEPNLDVREPR